VSLVESGILCRLEGPGSLSQHHASVEIRDETGRVFRPDVYGKNPIPICNLRPGRYRLFVYGYCNYDGEPWASQWYDGADSLAAATPIDLPSGRLVPIAVQLEPGGSIRGRVLDADGQPFSGPVAVFVRNGTRLCDDSWRYYPGSFFFPGLGNGDYLVATRSGESIWWFPGTSDRDSARVIAIRGHAQVEGIEWRLPRDPPGGHP
jgi:hypothetical protein